MPLALHHGKLRYICLTRCRNHFNAQIKDLCDPSVCMGCQGFSWSSVDYGGNWKLLHYSVRKLFKPILVSGELTLCLLRLVARSAGSQSACTYPAAYMM